MDVTQGFGSKWKECFHALGDHYSLDRFNACHLWLLHHLFVPLINVDCADWAASWNEHRLAQDGQGDDENR